MRIKLLAIFSLVGIASFVLLLFIYLITIIIIQIPFLISFEFAKVVQPYSLLGGIFIGISIASGNLLIRLKKDIRMKDIGISIAKKPFIFLATIFASIFIGWMTSYMISDLPALFLNMNAQKQEVSYSAIAISVWPSKKHLLVNCSAQLSFNEPSISPSIQYACLSWDQWLYYRDQEYPKEIILYGRKSYYGYELYVK